MEWKYRKVFLMGLLCLVCQLKTFSQQCLYFKYDKTGNRVESYEGNCGDEYKELSRMIIDKVSSENEGGQELSVYPNPHKGVFRIDMKDGDLSSAIYQIYDNKGVLVKTDYLDEREIDISNNPVGVYLLRVIKGESVRSMVVIKL